MKIRLLFAALIIQYCCVAQINPSTAPVVLQVPGMENVKVEKGLTYKTINDTTLRFDIYYPPGSDGKTRLPMVIFVNGVGIDALPTWRVYQDWARLVAVNGMIAVNHTSRGGKALKDTEALVDYLQKNATELGIDKDRVGIWSCSANVGVGLPLAMQDNRKYIRTLIMYYGAGWTPEDNVVKRQDLEIQVVRAGLDFHTLNQNIETFVKHAMTVDAHLEYINYPEGQHAFDIFDDTPRSKMIIQQTLDFLKQKLSKDYPVHQPFVLTNSLIWHRILEEKKIDETLAEFKKAMAMYGKMPNHTPWFNHVIDERNLNQLGYELLEAERNDDALKVFRANQEAFPESPNVYDALGDAYEKSGDKKNAAANAKLALEKLKKADIQPQMKEAIRKSAEEKLARLK